MTHSCSDFTSNIINHLLAAGVISAAVVESDDLTQQAAASIKGITALTRGNSLATQFMGELLGAHETLTEIGDIQGSRTLADCMYLLSAVQKGTFIEVYHPCESNILAIIKALPSADLWMTFVHEVSE